MYGPAAEIRLYTVNSRALKFHYHVDLLNRVYGYTGYGFDIFLENVVWKTVNSADIKVKIKMTDMQNRKKVFYHNLKLLIKSGKPFIDTKSFIQKVKKMNGI